MGWFVQGLFSFLKGLGAARMAAMAAVTLALVGFFGFVIMRVTTPPMATLFTDLSYEDSSAIIKDLERQGIPYEMKNDGAVIQVPKDKITRLRMKLAEGGLPKGGGIGYEIFDKSDALGSTSFVQNINHLRARQFVVAGDLAVIGVRGGRGFLARLAGAQHPAFGIELVRGLGDLVVVEVRGELDAGAAGANHGGHNGLDLVAHALLE